MANFSGGEICLNKFTDFHRKQVVASIGEKYSSHLEAELFESSTISHQLW